MRKADRLLKKWSVDIPREAYRKDVENLLNNYFSGQWDHKSGSHIVVRCEKLKTFQDYKPYGEISIPVKGGTKIKGRYVKELIKAIKLLNLSEGE